MSERREKNGSLEDGLVWWCVVRGKRTSWRLRTWRSLKNPIVCQQFPEQKECQGTKFYLIGMYSKTLDILTSYSQFVRLHGNSSISRDFTRHDFHWGWTGAHIGRVQFFVVLQLDYSNEKPRMSTCKRFLHRRPLCAGGHSRHVRKYQI